MRKRDTFCLALLWIVFLHGSYSAQSPAAKPLDPAGTVKAFYAYHFQRKCDFSLASLRFERKWLDENLYGLLVATLKKPVKPDEVPDLDGDPFTNSQDPPNSFRVGDSKQDERSASVAVSFFWKEKNKITDQRKIEVKLTKTATAWKISNIISGNTEDDDLIRLLKRSK
jgi:Protein of unknown function (DUF3828)